MGAHTQRVTRLTLNHCCHEEAKKVFALCMNKIYTFIDFTMKANYKTFEARSGGCLEMFAALAENKFTAAAATF